MPIVGGLDIHRKQITFDYLDTGTGQVRRGQVSPADREHLRAWLARFAGRDDVAFAVEGCTGWRYVAEELAAAGVAVHLAEPADTAFARGRKRHAKTDKTDCRHLRQLLAEGRLPECWIPPGHIVECRAMLELYNDLRAEHTAWAQRIHAVLFHQGAPALGEGALRSEQGLAGLRDAAAGCLSPAGQLQVATALEMTAALEARMHVLRHQLLDAARHLTGAKVHWQAGNRALPAPRVTVAGESALWVKPAEIPANDDIGKLGQALAAGRHGKQAELMANIAAYSGLRWGELTALTIPQVGTEARTIAVDRKVIEVAGHLYIEAPKNRKLRQTIYPRTTPGGYPLADELAGRIGQARAEQEAGTNPLGLIFPSPMGNFLRSSNFNRTILQPAYLAAGWRDSDGDGRWTWHSLRHVFCTTALFTWKLDATDVSCMAGHANVRTTLLMYVGTTAGVLDRARKATE